MTNTQSQAKLKRYLSESERVNIANLPIAGASARPFEETVHRALYGLGRVVSRDTGKVLRTRRPHRRPQRRGDHRRP